MGKAPRTHQFGIIPSRLRCAFFVLLIGEVPDLQGITMSDHNNSEVGPTLEQIQSLVNAGRLKDAAALCERLCAEPGVDARIWHILGAIYGENNDVVQAELCARKALAINPALGAAHHNLAILLIRQHKLKEAEQCLEQALVLRPEDALLYYKLGTVLRMEGRENEAINAFRQAIKINPRFRDAYFDLGNLFLDIRDLHSALGCVRAAYACDNSFVRAKAVEASILELQGDVEDAWRCIMPLLQKEIVVPEVALAIAFAVVSVHIGKESEAIDYLQKTITADKGGDYNHAGLYFHLGKLQERTQQYSAAFQSYSKGNELSVVPNNADEFIGRMHHERDIYAKAVLTSMPRATSGGKGLIFIVGMPRSGTSLVEQILSVHTRVRACGELGLLGSLSDNVLLEIQGKGEDADISSLDPQSVERHRQGYMNVMRANYGLMERYTDKNPHNFLHLGLVDVLFPEAHIIHCVRNPLDTCVSCFSNTFLGKNLSYSRELDSLGTVYKEYAHLMDHWKETLSVPILDVQYESLVADIAPWVRQILEFCGLEWEAGCLDFYKDKRQVYTVSYNQVRQPVYSSSVNRWKNFDEMLGPLRAALGDLADSD